MSSQATGIGTSNDGEFGANEWLVAELYEQFREDKNSVDKEWWPTLEAYAAHVSGASAKPAASAPSQPAAAQPATTSHPVTAPVPTVGSQPVARTTARPAAAQPVPAQAPTTPAAEVEQREDVVTP